MSNLKVCRICLRAQCKVFKYDRYQLRAYYEEVMAQKMNDKDGLPHYFCYECATILHQFHKFKEKCWMGQRVLKQIQVKQKGKLTYEAVHKVNRSQFSLKSPLGILTVTNRVKTYVSTDLTENSETECEQIETDDDKEINKNIEEEEMVCNETDNEEEMNIKDNEEKEVFLNKADDENEIDIVEEPVFCNEGSTHDDQYDSDTPIENLKSIITYNENEQDQKPIASNNEDLEDDVEATDNKSMVSEEMNVCSPKTVFVDVKKDVILLKNEKMKDRKKSILAAELGLIKKPKFATPKMNHLDKDNWTMYILSEEEAVKEFQLRAENEAYKDAAFKCDDCFKGFSKEDMLKRHNQLRHSESLGKFECRFCHKRFKWNSKLRRHMMEHFTRYKCLLCGMKMCIENTAILHEDWHKGALKKCQHCGEEFRHRSTYYTHLRTHRSEHLCALCGMSFVSTAGLQMHRKIKHVDDLVNDEDDDDAPVNTFCEKCDIRFETRKAFEEHLFHSAMHIDSLDTGLPRKVLGKRTQDQILGKSGKRTRDMMCNSTDDDTPTLNLKTGRRPRLRRSHRKPTTCNQCGKHFPTQAACMKHHQAEHPRTSFFSERHICEICGASLAPGSVTMHQNIHSRQKEYPCDTCGRKFHSYAGVKRHLVTHTGEKPFGCSLCDKRFTQSNSLKLHYKTFHLKQPYPKRNRRKKKDDLPDLPPTEDKSTSEESEAEASLPEPEPRTEPAATQTDETMHYLTLS